MIQRGEEKEDLELPRSVDEEMETLLENAIMCPPSKSVLLTYSISGEPKFRIPHFARLHRQLKRAEFGWYFGLAARRRVQLRACPYDAQRPPDGTQKWRLFDAIFICNHILDKLESYARATRYERDTVEDAIKNIVFITRDTLSGVVIIGFKADEIATNFFDIMDKYDEGVNGAKSVSLMSSASSAARHASQAPLPPLELEIVPK